MKPTTTRRERLARRRRLYTGGALLIVAPLATSAGCGKDLVIAPIDTRDAGQQNQRDAGPVDATVIAPIRADVGFPEDAGPVIAIAPLQTDAAVSPDASGPIMIAPVRLDASVAEDAGPVIAIAPFDPDAGLALAGGHGSKCSADGECLQEYSCQTPICIVACPSTCEPLPCSPDCPTGYVCKTYGSVDTCVRDPGGTKGGYGATCTADTDCQPQLLCQDDCGGICIAPMMRCTPKDCTATACPANATCEDVGITRVCVRK